MSFLQPWWALLALLAVPLVFLHGRRASRRVVPALTIWRLVGTASTPARSRAWRPRLTASLLLQLAALLALVLALMGPRPAATRADHHLLVVDRSASMGAASEASTRLELALDAARAELGALDPHDRGGPLVSLLVVGSDVRVEAARRPSARPVLRALDAIEATAAPESAPWSRVAESVRGLVEPGERVRITVLTDGAGAEPARSELADGAWRVDLRSFGGGADAHGLATVRAIPLAPEEGRWRIEGELVALPPTGEPVTIEVLFERADVAGALPWDEVELVPREERTPFSFETEVPSAGVLSLRLPEDALPVDDVARLALRDEPIALRTLLWGTVPDGLREAVASLEGASVTELDAAAVPPDGAGFDLAVVGADANADRTASGPPARTVLWIDGASPLGRHELRAEPLAELVAGPPVAGWSAPTDVPDGALERSYRVPRLAGAEVLLEAGDEPLLQVRVGEERTDVVAAWPLGATAWAREIGFAAFLVDVAASAEPRHGRFAGARCIAGRGCGSLRAAAAPPAALGVRMGENGPWVLDGEAGAESDLRREGAAGDVSPGFPWSRLDRLLAALAALLLALDGAWSWRRGRGAPSAASRRTRRLARAGRTGATVALALVAAGAPFPVLRPAPKPVVVVDPVTWPAVVAGDGASAEALRRALDEAGTVVLAERSGRIASRDPDAWRDDGALVGYDVEAVLDLAAGLVRQPGGRIVLAGLGFDAGAAAGDPTASLVSRGVEVDARPAAAPAAAEAWVDALSVPTTARAGERLRARAVVAGPARGEHGVRLLVDGEEAGTLPSGAAGDALRFEAGEEGVRTVRAELTPSDAGLGANDARTALVEVLPPVRLAIVTAAERDAGFRASLEEPEVARRFRDEAVEVVAWRPRDVPVEAEAFLDVDVVALLDVPAVDLHGRQQGALERWVREYGGGLLVAGTEGAFGPGGYLQTPLETLSPLSGRVPGEQPQAAVAFVIDRSGSMQQTTAGVSRLAIAKDATLAAVELLHPASEVAIVVFDDVATTLVPLGPPDALREALAPVTPGGGTHMYPAIEAAYRQLAGSDAEAKHMIVLTDGLAKTAPFDALVDRVAAADITISTVAIGSAPDVTLLESIARAAGGVFHQSADVRSLPSILSQEAMLLSGDPVREGEVTPELVSHRAAFLEALEDPFPAIPGYVRTTPQPEADVHAVTAGGDPILASWRHGVGRVVAFATPLEGPWAEGWTSEPFASELLREVVRWLEPPVVAPGLALSARPDGDALRLDAVAVDAGGRGAEGVRVTVEVDLPAGRTVDAGTMAELGDGRYALRVPAYESGRYEVRAVAAGLAVADEDEEAASAARPVHVSFPASLAPGPEGAAGPMAIARATGGRLLLDAEAPPRGRGWRAAGSRALAPWALLVVGLAGAGLAAEAWGRRPPTRAR